MIFNKFLITVKNEEGASMVEFAIVLPLLLLLIFGLIEFGLLYHDYLAVTHAAREGARMAAVNKFDEPTVKDRTGFIDVTAVTVVKSYPSGSNTGDPVEVTVAYPHSFLTGYLQAVIFRFPPTVTLESKAVMRLEQPGN